MNEFNIMHICNTESCSSGGPIINLSINKVIGIHKGRILEENKIQYNAGIFLKYPLNEIHMLKIEKSIIKPFYELNRINNNDILIDKNIRELLNLKNKKEKKNNKYFEMIKNNEIKMNVKIKNKDINKEIFFLDNTI